MPTNKSALLEMKLAIPLRKLAIAVTIDVATEPRVAPI